MKGYSLNVRKLIRDRDKGLKKDFRKHVQVVMGVYLIDVFEKFNMPDALLIWNLKSTRIVCPRWICVFL